MRKIKNAENETVNNKECKKWKNEKRKQKINKKKQKMKEYKK